MKEPNEQRNSISAIGKFKQANKLTSKSLLLKFEATVEYPFQSITSNTTVQIALDTIKYGNIDIVDTESISSDKVHTGFSPKFQNYSYDNKNNILRIQGESAKMGGSYAVLITPIL